MYGNGEIVAYNVLREIPIQDTYQIRKKLSHRGNGITTCWHCGRKLTDELSFARGVGPVCFNEYGPIAGRASVEKFAKLYKRYQRSQIRLNKKVLSLDKWMGQLPVALLNKLIGGT